MRYLEAENPYIICRFTTGDTVTINIHDLSDDSLVVNGASMSEIGTTGYFKYLFNPAVSTLKEYIYIATNSIEEHAGKIILGGYPDDIKDQTDKLLFDASSYVKSIAQNQPVQHGVALDNFTFLMTDSTNHEPATGLTITAEISKDGGAFAACTNSPVEIGNGVYKISLTATEMDAKIITLKFTATGADQNTIVLVTEK